MERLPTEHVGDVPPGGAAAMTAQDTARATFTRAWSPVAGVSGVPKQPQLASAPPRWRTRSTARAKTANDAATAAASGGVGQANAASPRRSSPAARRGTTTANRPERPNTAARPRTVVSGRTALLAPASTSSVQAMKYTPIMRVSPSARGC